MSGRSTQYGSASEGIVGDPWALDPGRQIDWDTVADTYINAATGKKVIPHLTAMGQQIDLDASGPGMISPRVDSTNPAIGLLIGTAVEGDVSAAKSGYGLLRGVEASCPMPQGHRARSRRTSRTSWPRLARRSSTPSSRTSARNRAQAPLRGVAHLCRV